MTSGNHILAGLTLGFRWRRDLARLLRTTPAEQGILSLDPARLKQEGIAALALDFDGVLAPHGFPAPLPATEQWLARAVSSFGADRVFILSNKPTEERRIWFERHVPQIRFISGVARKPFPDGLNMTGELAGVPLSAILMVDDRLLTGCLAALNAGALPCYIRAPYRSFRHLPFTELFFALLRTGERIMVRLAG
jgi:predicted HAD superfamily phosphohydrolase YqeG